MADNNQDTLASYVMWLFYLYTHKHAHMHAP